MLITLIMYAEALAFLQANTPAPPIPVIKSNEAFEMDKFLNEVPNIAGGAFIFMFIFLIILAIFLR